LFCKTLNNKKKKKGEAIKQAHKREPEKPKAKKHITTQQNNIATSKRSLFLLKVYPSSLYNLSSWYVSKSARKRATRPLKETAILI
jgi:hypothetical protein